jgi:hypothetical protein
VCSVYGTHRLKAEIRRVHAQNYGVYGEQQPTRLPGLPPDPLVEAAYVVAEGVEQVSQGVPDSSAAPYRRGRRDPRRPAR